MSRESVVSTSRHCVFRETFNSPASVAKNGGVITGGVTLENGVATMDGTGYITYAGNKALSNKSKFTIRMKARRSAINKLVYVSFFTDINNRVELLLYLDGKIYGVNCNGANNHNGSASGHNDVESHDFCYVFDGSGTTSADKMKLYEDGVPLTLSFMAVIPAVTVTLGTFYIGKGFAGNSEGSFELIEIYDGAFSPEEINLLFNNRLYRGFVDDGSCILHADYTKGTSLNWKDTDGTHTDTNATYLHNIGLHCDTTTKTEYGAALAISGDWSLETVVDRNGLGDFYPIGVTASDEGLYIDIGSSGNWGFYDGTSALTAEASVDYFNRQHLVVTKEGTSYKFYRGGILVNTVVGIDLDITQITVGMLGDGTGGMNGNVVYTREYIGVLSPENVRQNYQAVVNKGYLNV